MGKVLLENLTALFLLHFVHLQCLSAGSDNIPLQAISETEAFLYENHCRPVHAGPDHLPDDMGGQQQTALQSGSYYSTGSCSEYPADPHAALTPFLPVIFSRGRLSAL